MPSSRFSMSIVIDVVAVYCSTIFIMNKSRRDLTHNSRMFLHVAEICIKMPILLFWGIAMIYRSAKPSEWIYLCIADWLNCITYLTYDFNALMIAFSAIVDGRGTSDISTKHAVNVQCSLSLPLLFAWLATDYLVLQRYIIYHFNACKE